MNDDPPPPADPTTPGWKPDGQGWHGYWDGQRWFALEPEEAATGQALIDAARSQPKRPKRPKRPKPASTASPVRSAVLWCGLIAAVLIVLGVIARDNSPSTDERKATATSACEASVSKQLKAPAGADFSDEVVAAAGPEEAFRVSGSVDAENSFGAKIRNRWICDATPDGDEGDYSGLAIILDS